MSVSLYDKVRKRRSLDNAWRVVHANGVTSKSDSTRKQIKEFELDVNKHLNRICRQLAQKRFKFLPSEGILQSKPGKISKRPIVKSPIENRIVQRALLDVLQSYPPLNHYFTSNTSFGGIKGRSVSDALSIVHTKIQSGAKYFIRSDIESFFTRIPKPTVLSIVGSTISDDIFLSLFEQAIHVELSNLEQLGKERNAFPIYDIGVAQGSCLSPLLGNILLSNFDREMNQGDITCIRYIDDFVILAPSIKAINAAFKRALKLLNTHGLHAYDPKNSGEKAEFGRTTEMFAFLGCDIRPGMIRPNRNSQRRLLASIDDAFTQSSVLMGNPALLVKKHRTVTETLVEVGNILKGWGSQYSFCNDINLMKRIDGKVDHKIACYLTRYSEQKEHFSSIGEPCNRRRLLGVHLLSDSKRDPIIN